MPELAEVEYYRTRWDPGVNQVVKSVYLHGDKRIFRGSNPVDIPIALTGRKLLGSVTHGKQMLFRFGGGHHLGVHLGMTGEMSFVCRARGGERYAPEKHDHFVLYVPSGALVYRDPRLFGRIRFSSAQIPSWWVDLPPEILSAAFSREALSKYLARHRNAPLKALLLDQSHFPGVGNWMADEILWRAELHPRTTGGFLSASERGRLWKETRAVCRSALKIIAPHFADPPKSWLFQHRWKDGGFCPKTGIPLIRETIGGRTTCWSPGRQFPPLSEKRKA